MLVSVLSMCLALTFSWWRCACRYMLFGVIDHSLEGCTRLECQRKWLTCGFQLATWRAPGFPRLGLRPPRGPPGCGLNRPTWSPVKGSFARVSTIRLAIVVRQRFFGIPATDTDII